MLLLRKDGEETCQRHLRFRFGAFQSKINIKTENTFLLQYFCLIEIIFRPSALGQFVCVCWHWVCERGGLKDYQKQESPNHKHFNSLLDL